MIGVYIDRCIACGPCSVHGMTQGQRQVDVHKDKSMHSFWEEQSCWHVGSTGKKVAVKFEK